MASDNKKDYLTLLSVLSAVAVLILHTNGCFWEFSATERYWATANVIESVCYFAVPIFLMISSITLIDFNERYTLKEFFIKRFNKAFIPFVSWSIICMIYQMYMGKIKVYDLSVRFVIQGIFDNSFVSIFWFFNSLFLIYLCMPLFSAVSKSNRRNTFKYLVLSALVLNVIYPLANAVFSFGIYIPLNIAVVLGALLWIPMGWLLDNTEFNRREKIGIYVAALFGLMLHIVGTYVLSVKAGNIVDTFKGYENLPCILYSSGIFVLAKDIEKKIMVGRFKRFIVWLGRYTFPIYLMQFILLDYVNNELLFIDTHSIIYRLGAPFVMIPIIIFVTFLLRKIPIINRIVP